MRVTVEIPESLAALMKGLPIEKMTYEAIVLDLYRRSTISSGKAAELLGLPRVEFIKSFGKLGIPSCRRVRKNSRPKSPAPRLCDPGRRGESPWTLLH